LTPDGSGAALDNPVATLRGVGSANAAKLAKLGIVTVRDILYYFPVRHIDYRDTRPISQLAARGSGVFQTIQATVVEVRVERLRGRQSPAGQWLFGDVPEPRPGRPGLLRITARLRDATGSVTATWIRAQDYLSREFTPGRLVMLSGEIHSTWRGEELEFSDPDFEFVGGDETIHTGRLVPVYRLET
jgi:ATP-dependent DNA helicase RecG